MCMKNIFKIIIFKYFIYLIIFSLPIFSKVENKPQEKKLSIIEKIDPSCKTISLTSPNRYELKNNKIKIVFKNSKKWTKHLLRAKTNLSPNITKKFKKKFNAELIIKLHSKDSFCIFPAKIRISGDWKDHIMLHKNNGSIISSMDVKLIKDNIDGIVNFKLFIPETRNSDNEIITANLMKELGYLSPRTRYVDVEINNKSYKFIMQEKFNKEFIENNNLRESALVGVDESLLWNLRAIKKGRYNYFIFPKVINHKWAKKNRQSLSISLNGNHILSNAILEIFNLRTETYRGRDNSLSDKILSNGNKKSEIELSTFRALLLSMKASHALINHNRRFYYDALNSSLLPIYYDGDSSITSLNNVKNTKDLRKAENSNFLKELNIEDVDLAIEILEKINQDDFLKKINFYGVEVNKFEIAKILLRTKENLNFIKSYLLRENKFKYRKNKNKIYDNLAIKYGLAFSKDGYLYELCETKSKCVLKNLNEEERIQILRGRYKKNEKNFYFAGPSSERFFKGNFLSKVKNVENNIFFDKDSIQIIKIGDPKINFNKIERKIIINSKSINDKVVFEKSNLDNWTIIFNGPVNNFKNTKNDRFDINLLTGLLTIKDSTINNLKIFISNGFAEDSLNIINSNGSLNNIEIKNSYQDSIDFDFSELTIKNIKITNSGNDCIDMSYGNYQIMEISAINCKDKAISAGEKSYVKINNALLDNNNFGIVSKDSSKLLIDKGVITNYKICLSAYRKKQEFDGGLIIAPKDLCPKSEIYIQNKSEIIFK